MEQQPFPTPSQFHASSSCKHSVPREASLQTLIFGAFHVRFERREHDTVAQLDDDTKTVSS